jgi:hypothetical protein
MKTFDDIEVRRPELAESYLSLIQAQPGRPLAMFAPRRVGKTYFWTMTSRRRRAAQSGCPSTLTCGCRSRLHWTRSIMRSKKRWTMSPFPPLQSAARPKPQ